MFMFKVMADGFNTFKGLNIKYILSGWSRIDIEAKLSQDGASKNMECTLVDYASGVIVRLSLN